MGLGRSSLKTVSDAFWATPQASSVFTILFSELMTHPPAVPLSSSCSSSFKWPNEVRQSSTRLLGAIVKSMGVQTYSKRKMYATTCSLHFKCCKLRSPLHHSISCMDILPATIPLHQVWHSRVQADATSKTDDTLTTGLEGAPEFATYTLQALGARSQLQPSAPRSSAAAVHNCAQTTAASLVIFVPPRSFARCRNP